MYVKVREYIKEWNENPWKAVAFLQEMLLGANIVGKDELLWSYWDGVIIIQNEKAPEKYDIDVKIKEEKK